jgi:methionyl-tRNA formyltransferase
MRFSILTSSEDHPIIPLLRAWVATRSTDTGQIVFQKRDLAAGDILFLVSCHEMVGPKTRSKFRHTLVLHASPLPKGRGWSPHIWQVLEGSRELTCTLLEADEPVDSGAIWGQVQIPLEGHELYDEINAKLFRAEMDLMGLALDSFDRIQPIPQESEAATWYRRRTPDDSRIDVNRPIAEQFDLLRVADPHRFPAYFTHRGYRYAIQIHKLRPEDPE